MALLDAQQARLQLEERLATLTLSFPSNRSATWEYAQFPNMAAIYWNLARTSIVPEQDVFVQAVAALLDQGDNPDVLARAARTYPALVRQHHFALVLKEHFPLVVRSEELDLHGVDILVVEDGRAYGVALSVETASAHDWQRIKNRRHPPPPGLPILWLYARPDGYRVGPFWLHPPKQAEEVRAFITLQRPS
ncbi:MAG TPA: hypothetical protein VFZ25_07145 [Chloroflexota bacterium]|nr:hypothetical protein [Chloroflexota bacterium]